MNLVLFGMQGCGKTTLGQKVAKKLKKAFIDTDQLVEKTYQLAKQKQLSCREIYQEMGAAGFRSLEYEVVQSLQDVQNSVIAAGGGTMLLMENAEVLSQHGSLVYLIENKETLRKRVFSQSSLPAFLDPKNPERSFDRVYEERDDLYRRLRAIELDISKMKEEEVIEKLYQIAQSQEKDGKQ